MIVINSVLATLLTAWGPKTLHIYWPSLHFSSQGSHSPGFSLCCCVFPACAVWCTQTPVSVPLGKPCLRDPDHPCLCSTSLLYPPAAPQVVAPTSLLPHMVLSLWPVLSKLDLSGKGSEEKQEARKVQYLAWVRSEQSEARTLDSGGQNLLTGAPFLSVLVL